MTRIAVGGYIYPNPELNSMGTKSLHEQISGITNSALGALRVGQLGEKGLKLYNAILAYCGYSTDPGIAVLASKFEHGWKMLSVARIPGVYLEFIEAVELMQKGSVSHPNLGGVSQAFSREQRFYAILDVLNKGSDASAMSLYSVASVISAFKATARFAAPCGIAADLFTAVGHDTPEVLMNGRNWQKASQVQAGLIAQGAPQDAVEAYGQTATHSKLRTFKAIGSVIGAILTFGMMLGVIQVSALALAILAFTVTILAVSALVYKQRMKNKPIDVIMGAYNEKVPALPQVPAGLIVART